MTSHRDKAFEAFYESLKDKGGIGGRDLLRTAWEAGRRYETERLEAIMRRSMLNTPLRPTDNQCVEVATALAASPGEGEAREE